MFCKCPDIDERLRGLRKFPNICMAWCEVCDRHIDRCMCDRHIDRCGSKKPN
jgi:hypothetical protein